jgi:hypothetical protein
MVVNYHGKEFYDTVTRGQCYKTLYHGNMQCLHAECRYTECCGTIIITNLNKSFLLVAGRWVTDMFCNFYLMKNHKIAKISTTTETIEKLALIWNPYNFRFFMQM